MTNDPLTVIYVVDDDIRILSSTLALLEPQGWEIRCLSSAAEFLATYEEKYLGCLVLDLELPEMGGLELQQMMAERGMDIPIVFVTGQASVANSVKALKAGAVDFLEKPVNHETLVETIKNGLTTQGQKRKEKLALGRVQSRFSDLTDREWDIVDAIVSGPGIRSSKEVARILGISHRTVEHHRASIMTKTQARSLPELIRLASFIGIADPDLVTNN